MKFMRQTTKCRCKEYRRY